MYARTRSVSKGLISRGAGCRNKAVFNGVLQSRNSSLYFSSLPEASGGSSHEDGPSEERKPLMFNTPEEARAKALSIYRQLIRGGKKMPTPNRQNFVLEKTRTEYRNNMNLTDPLEIDFCLRLADTNLDTVMVQAEHLTTLFNDPSYRFRDEI